MKQESKSQAVSSKQSLISELSSHLLFSYEKESVRLDVQLLRKYLIALFSLVMCSAESATLVLFRDLAMAVLATVDTLSAIAFRAAREPIDGA